MAASFLKVCAAAFLYAAAGAQAAELGARDQPIDFKSHGGYEVDFRTGKTIMHNVSVSQGDVSITADRAEATGLDFKDSRWVFTGDVRIKAEQRGSMRSDRAEVEFHNNRIARATIKGDPAEFEQRRTASNQMARGRAGRIMYEVGAGTVRFADNAWLTNGDNEISGPVLVYDIRQEKVQGERVRITIVPKPAAERPQPESPASSERESEGSTR
jgi:lipopolysaccharide transport protein LptA